MHVLQEDPLLEVVNYQIFVTWMGITRYLIMSTFVPSIVRAWVRTWTLTSTNDRDRCFLPCVNAEGTPKLQANTIVGYVITRDILLYVVRHDRSRQWIRSTGVDIPRQSGVMFVLVLVASSARRRDEPGHDVCALVLCAAGCTSSKY